MAYATRKRKYKIENLKYTAIKSYILNFKFKMTCRCDGMVDIADLKSVGHCARAGSSPAIGTINGFKGV